MTSTPRTNRARDLAFLESLTQSAAPMQADGPPVDHALLEDYVDGCLDAAAWRLVVCNTTKYQRWAAALLSIRTAVPEVEGPPVECDVLAKYLAGNLPSTAEVAVRRKIRLYRNWYYAAIVQSAAVVNA